MGTLTEDDLVLVALAYLAGQLPHRKDIMCLSHPCKEPAHRSGFEQVLVALEKVKNGAASSYTD